ncbi:agmatine deiminase [Nocardia sp. NPDC051030]|uniref:agmatine deiminase n=1 Tax=Nocardia sp. NPDC051030 TaxID=3155162 RepID=UPI0034212000
MNAELRTIPATDGYRMPAEWEPHGGCYLAWPENTYFWRQGAKPVQHTVVAIADAIAATGEQVTVTVSSSQYLHARLLLPDAVRVVEISTFNAWARDIAPSFLVDDHGGLRGVDWRFDGYGNRSPYWHLDNGYAARILDLERLDRYAGPIVFEGGMIDVDGLGTGIVAAECLLDPVRYRNPNRDTIIDAVRDYLGVRKLIWLPFGLVDDDTAGHMDNMARFVSPGTVALAWTGNERDPQFERSAAAWELLTAETDADGKPLTVHKIPIPGPLHMTAEESLGTDIGARIDRTGQRLAGSYLNFYISNGAVLIPALDPATDDEAAAILSGLLPGREPIQLPSRELLLGGGNIHCATRQIPATTRRQS